MVLWLRQGEESLAYGVILGWSLPVLHSIYPVSMVLHHNMCEVFSKNIFIKKLLHHIKYQASQHLIFDIFNDGASSLWHCEPHHFTF